MMEERYRGQEKDHEIKLNNREELKMTGVSHVESFDEKEIILETCLGVLVIKGEELSIKQLNLEDGNVAIDGMVKSLCYAEEGLLKDMKNKSKGLLNRMFG